MRTLGYVSSDPNGGLMISETEVSHWTNEAVVSRNDAERAIAEAVTVERDRWSATVANALNWLKHGRIANARDDLKAAQRRAVNEAERVAVLLKTPEEVRKGGKK